MFLKSPNRCKSMSMKSSWKQNSLSYKRGRKIELSRDCKKYVHIQQT